MNVREKILFLFIVGCALLAHSAAAATIVAASDASAASKASAQYVCDGSGDQEQINQALAGGGEVILTEGTFRTTGTIYVMSNTVFSGQGPDKTILSMAGDYAARVDIAQPSVTVSDFKITNRGWLMITTSHVKVHDITIQDSKKTAPTVNGMFFVWADGKVCEDIEFIRCKAIDVGSTGFNLNGQKSPRVNRNIRFEECLALRCGNDGSGKQWAVGFDFHEGADLYDLYVNNCRAEDCWESGFYFEPNFYNGNDPNTAIPVQVNSRVNNCVAVNNGWRNTLSTRFYMTGYYLSCGVTLNNCVSINSRNNGFWVWQGAKDVILNGCTDDGSDKAFQVRSGTNLKFNNCIAKNSRTYALYMWGSNGVIFDDFRIINPKKSSGAVSLGLREDHPNDPWPVTGCTLDILLTGADAASLIRYYNAQNNQITINGDSTTVPTSTITPYTTLPTTIATSETTTPVTTVTPGPLPTGVGNGVIPGTIEMEDYDDGGPNIAYYDTTDENEGGDYRQDGVDIEYINSAGSHVVCYARPGEWLQYTVNVTTTGTYDVSFKVSSTKAGTSFTMKVDGTDATTVSVPNTNDWNTFTEVKKQVALTKGKHTLRIATNGYHNLCCMRFALADTTLPTPTATTTVTGTTPTPTVTPTIDNPQQPGANVPGTIEAEDFNSGGEGIAYHDTTTANQGGQYRTSEAVDIERSSSEGGHVVCWVRAGEWIKYTATVAEAGVYDVSFRVSSDRSDGSFRMQVDNKDACTVMVPNTGSFDSYTTVVQQVSLPAGVHTIRLYFNGYTNLNWMKFQSNSGSTPTTTTVAQTTVPTGTPTATQTSGSGLPVPIPNMYGNGRIPGVIEGEDYNSGGAGVAYYDTTASNFGGVYRMDDVDIELNQNEDSPVVCWIRPGEWLKYTANVETTGYYDVVFRVASPNSNSQIRLQVDGVTATTFTVPNTGDYAKFTSVTKRIYMKSGPHVLRLVFGGYQNFNYMSFTAAGTQSSTRVLESVTANETIPTVTIRAPAIAPQTTLANAAAPTEAPTSTATTVASQAPTTAMTTVAPDTTTITPTPTVEVPPPTTAVPTTIAATATETPTPTGTATAIVTPTETTVTTAIPTTIATETTTTPAATTAAPTVTIPTSTTAEPTTIATTTIATSMPTATVTVTATATETATPIPTATVPVQNLLQTSATDRNLSVFVTAVEKTGLAATLNSAGPYTVFAPTDEAFEELPEGALDALLADRERLASVLRLHVVEGRLASSDLVGMPAVLTLEGETVPVTMEQGIMMIGDASMNLTDIQASNGVIHVIDAVNLPPDLFPTSTATVTSISTQTDVGTTLPTPAVPIPNTTATKVANRTV
jgi:uncharacterized surface protein with fasciclin (FAS1) repeats